MKRFARFIFAFVLVLPFITFAQDVAVVDPTSIITEGVKTLFASAQNKNWALFIPTLVVLLVTVFRWLGNRFAKEGTGFHKFLDNKWTKWAMNFVTTMSGAFIGAATAKQPITVNLVLNAVMLAFTAAGGVEFMRDVMSSINTKKAKDAGGAAVADPGKTLNG